MNNEIFSKMIDTVFSGKGGTVRLAIVVIGALAFFEEIAENRFEFLAKTNTGKMVSIKPTMERGEECEDVQSASPSMPEEGDES